MEKGLNKILIGFILIVLAAVLIPVAADLINAKTTVAVATDIPFNIAAARLAGNNINESNPASNATLTGQYGYPWKATDCPATNFLYGNLTTANATTAWTLNTDYTVDLSLGILHVKNSTNTIASRTNLTYMDYNYCPNDYINNSFGRNIISLIAGFMVLLVLIGVAIGLVVSGIKDWYKG